MPQIRRLVSGPHDALAVYFLDATIASAFVARRYTVQRILAIGEPV